MTITSSSLKRFAYNLVSVLCLHWRGCHGVAKLVNGCVFVLCVREVVKLCVQNCKCRWYQKKQFFSKWSPSFPGRRQFGTSISKQICISVLTQWFTDPGNPLLMLFLCAQTLLFKTSGSSSSRRSWLLAWTASPLKSNGYKQSSVLATCHSCWLDFVEKHVCGNVFVFGCHFLWNSTFQDLQLIFFFFLLKEIKKCWQWSGFTSVGFSRILLSIQSVEVYSLTFGWDLFCLNGGGLVRCQFLDTYTNFPWLNETSSDGVKVIGTFDLLSSKEVGVVFQGNKVNSWFVKTCWKPSIFTAKANKLLSHPETKLMG